MVYLKGCDPFVNHVNPKHVVQSHPRIIWHVWVFPELTRICLAHDQLLHQRPVAIVELKQLVLCAPTSGIVRSPVVGWHAMEKWMNKFMYIHYVCNHLYTMHVYIYECDL